MGRRGGADVFAATALALASACPPTLRAITPSGQEE